MLSRSAGGRGRQRMVVALLAAITAIGGALPPATVVAAKPEPTAPPAGTGPGGVGELDARQGRVVERPAIELGLLPGAGPAGGFDGTSTTIDPSIKPRPVFPATVPPAVAREVDWTERSTTVANPDGSFTLSVSGGRMNYQEPNGRWHRLDLSTTRENSGAYTRRVKGNDRLVRLADVDAAVALASVTTRHGTVKVRGLEAGTTLVSDPASEELRFHKDPSHADLFVRPSDVGFEYGAIVEAADQSNVIAFVVDLGPLQPELQADGSILLRLPGAGNADDPVGAISAPILLDANEVPAPQSVVSVVLTDGASGDPLPAGVTPEAVAALGPNEAILSYTIDPGWLAARDRAFPLMLDPTACLGEGASGCDINGTGVNLDHFVGSGIATLYPIGWTTMRVGYDSRSDDGETYGTMRGLVYFQDVTLPDGAVVYDTNLTLHISSEYGGPTNEDIYAYRVTDGWGQTTTWNQWSSGVGYTTTGGVFDTVPASGTMAWDVDTIVQSWYTRRAADWKGDIGFAIRMNPDSSGHGEVEFDRYNDATASYRPKLTITYEIPKVSIDFDPALGANYAPSTMLKGQPTVLPIRVTNNSSGFDFTTANWLVGSRWFDSKGKVIGAPATQALPGCIGTGTGCSPTSATFGLNVTPPSTVGQYTLRLDLVRNATNDMFASDWATPSKYLSRNKKTLSADGTRWTGSSVIERDEFGISVVEGVGGAGAPRSVATGDDGEIGINLWSRNLSYKGGGGIGFADLVPMELEYGYDSKLVGDCSGIMDACGWATTWDERFITGTTPDGYIYVDPSGDRHLVDADSDQQLVSGAGVLLQRPRTTLFDENVPTTTPTASLVQPTFGAFSGQYAVSVSAVTDPGVGLGSVGTINLNTYRNVRFAMRSASYASSGLAFKIHNNTTNADKWFIYTVGTNWTTGFEQVALGLQSGVTSLSSGWNYYARNLYQDVRSASGFGGTYDDYQVIAVQIQNPASATGTVYLDALRLEAGYTAIVADGNPTWSTGGSSTTLVTTDTAVGTSSVKITAAPISSSPDCNTTAPATPCWGTSAGGLWAYGFVRWQWKKVGGTGAAIVFHLKDVRTGTTGDLTYYAGPTAPVGAVNALQVSDVAPVGWSKVTRNLLQDARQVLNFFNDGPKTTSPSAPPSQGPTPDDVQMTGYRISGVDGNFLLFDDFFYASLPDHGADEFDHPNASTDTTFTYDFTATYRDGSVHYFDKLGLLERIADRDGHKVEFDWSISPTVVGPDSYRLEAIHAPTDGATYDRQVDVDYATAGANRTVSFTEILGATASPTTGRSTVFTVSGTSGSGDVLSVKPARAPSCAATGVSRCDLFTYAAGHLLTMVADPRWDQASTTGVNDKRFEITWNGADPLAVVDRSQGVPILRVPAFTAGAALPAATRAVWQDDAALAANHGRYVDITSDGKTFVEYIPTACAGTNCATPDATSLSSKKASESQFDGLARETTSISYRCPGVAVSGCAGTAQQVISRQGTRAGAKVDNYNDPLTAGQVGWSQSADQYVASLRDSGGVDKDLYRTFFAYDENGQQVSASRTAHNAKPDYPATVKSTTQFASALKGYWRLGETSGVSAVDQAPTPHNGTYGGTVGLNQPPALVNDTNRAVSFNGSNTYVSVPGLSLSGSYTVSAWVKPAGATTTMAFMGSRSGTASPTEFSFDVKLYYDTTLKTRNVRVDIGNGSTWLLSTNVPYDYQASRWYQIAVAVDDTADQATVYVNGDPVGVVKFTTAGTPLFSDADNVLRIGSNGRTSTTPEWFNGQIDEVAVWSQVLTAPQVESQYLAGHSVALATTKTLRDRSWRPLQVDDQALASPGFESGLVDWDFGQGNGGVVHLAAGNDPSSDPFLHQPTDPALPPSWASFQTNLNGNAQQDVQLVPGQTVRLQLWQKKTGAATARVNLYYWQKSSASWQALVNVAYNDTSWTSRAWDVTLPLDTDGRVRVALWVQNAAGTDSVYFDDVALLTTYARTNYTSTAAGDPYDGLTKDVITFSPTSSGPIAEFRARTTYGATSTVPAIFPTTTTSNYQDGAYSSATPDADVSVTTVYDPWGHTIQTTDQDGVTATTTYVSSGSANGFATDVSDTRNGLNETTAFQYDEVGNRTQTTTPKNETSTTTFDLRGHELMLTGPAPSSIVTKNVYNAYGQLTSSIANWEDGVPSGAAGTDDVITSFAYDQFGEQTSVTANTGLAGTTQARTARTHDLLGNDVATTVYATFDGTTFGAPRTTTQLFETASGAWRDKPSATRGPGSAAPLVPTGAPAPACPDGSGSFCNSVSRLDQDGQVIAETDAYGVVSKTFRDLAGKPVFVIDSFVDGVYNPLVPDEDLVTTTQNDLFGRPAVSIDPMGRKTTTAFDALGRITKQTNYDWNGSTATAVSDTRTVYTGSGRVDRVSMPGTAGAADSTFTWTKTIYDRAGRVIKTLVHYDITGGAGLAIDSFEAPESDVTINNDASTESWSVSAGAFISAGASKTLVGAATSAKSGSGRLSVTTGSGTNTGVEWNLDGTFQQGHPYRARVWVNPPAGTQVDLRMGITADAASDSTPVIGNGTWQALDVTWTPTAPRTSVKLAVYRVAGAAAATFAIDDATAWDSASGATDVNIPTETAYDADGHVVASIVAPGIVGGSEEPMVTRTTYDERGRITRITVNEIAGAGTGPVDVNLASDTSWDDLDRQATKTDPTGTVTRLEYDRLGRLVATTLNYQNGTSGGPFTDDDVRSEFAYNAAGEMVGYCAGAQLFTGLCDETSAGDVRAWHYTFDDAGNMVRQVPPVNAGPVQALSTLLSEYDAGGRLTKSCEAPAGTATCTTAGVLRTTIPTYDKVGRSTRSDVYAGQSTLALRTDTVYLGDGQPAQTKLSSGTGPTVVDTIDYLYDNLGRQTKVLRGGTVLAERSYNPDGTVAWRKDGDAAAIGQTTFTYDWADRLLSADLPNTFSAAIPTFTWRLDGLIATRTWSGGAATFAYDAAKRPTAITKGSLTLTQAYDRDGNVVSEGRTLTGVSGDAGTGLQSFQYDALNRVIGSSGLSNAITYQYDRDSNRTKKTNGGVTFDYTFDRTGELATVTKTGQTPQVFTYDAFGNMLNDATSGVSIVTFTYDLDDHLTRIDDPGGTTNDATFTLDALGRFRTRALGSGSTDTYSYQDASEVVTRIANSASGNTDSLLSASGDRFGVQVGGTVNWFLPDLHGDIAGSLDAAETTVVNAIRYDAYGETITTGSAGGTRVGDKNWKYQGRLDISPEGLNSPLYDMSARFYDPGLGAFTQMDSVMGSAQNPITMNRFLYAGANPETLVDPSGHCWGICIDIDPFKFAGDVVNNTVQFGAGFVEGAVGTLVDSGVGLVKGAAAAGGCALDSSCRDAAVATIQRGAAAFAADPGKAIHSAAGAIVEGAKGAIKSTVDRVSYAWSTGNFRELGKMTGEVASNFVPVGGLLAKGGQLLRGLGGAANASRFIQGASAATRISGVGGRIEGMSSRLLGAAGEFSQGARGLLAAGRGRIASLLDREGSQIAARMRTHLDGAIDDFNTHGMTPRQAVAAAKNPRLAPMFKGERIDHYARVRSRTDTFLTSRGHFTPRGRFGPDFVRTTPRGYHRWYDWTTRAAAAAHRRLYTPRFGPGRPIAY